jgi:hypothetical protein
MFVFSEDVDIGFYSEVSSLFMMVSLQRQSLLLQSLLLLLSFPIVEAFKIVHLNIWKPRQQPFCTLWFYEREQTTTLSPAIHRLTRILGAKKMFAIQHLFLGFSHHHILHRTTSPWLDIVVWFPAMLSYPRIMVKQFFIQNKSILHRDSHNTRDWLQIRCSRWKRW